MKPPTAIAACVFPLQFSGVQHRPAQSHIRYIFARLLLNGLCNTLQQAAQSLCKESERALFYGATVWRLSLGCGSRGMQQAHHSALRLAPLSSGGPVGDAVGQLRGPPTGKRRRPSSVLSDFRGRPDHRRSSSDESCRSLRSSEEVKDAELPELLNSLRGHSHSTTPAAHGTAAAHLPAIRVDSERLSTPDLVEQGLRTDAAGLPSEASARLEYRLEMILHVCEIESGTMREGSAAFGRLSELAARRGTSTYAPQLLPQLPQQPQQLLPQEDEQPSSSQTSSLHTSLYLSPPSSHHLELCTSPYSRQWLLDHRTRCGSSPLRPAASALHPETEPLSLLAAACGL